MNRSASAVNDEATRWTMLVGFGAAGLAAGLLIWGVDWYHGKEGRRLAALKSRLAERESGSSAAPATHDRPAPPSGGL